MSKPPKYPDDFKGWKTLYKLTGNRYLVIVSPDHSKEACIHLEDNEVVGVKNRITGEDIYDGNAEKAKKMGLLL